MKEARIPCYNCKNLIESDSKYCKYCGARIGPESISEREIGSTWRAGVYAAKQKIRSAKKLVSAAANERADVTFAKKKLREAEKLLRSSDFHKAYEEAKRAEQLASDSRLYRKKELMIEKAVAEVENARQTGADISKADAYLDKAKSSLQEKAFADVTEYVRRAKEEAAEAKRYRRSSQMIQRVIPLIEYAKQIGSDVSRAEDFMNKAEEALENGVYGEVSEYVREVRLECSEAKRYRRAEISVEKATELVNEAEQAGAEIEEALEQLGDARDALERKEYGEVVGLCKSIRSLARTALRRKEIENEIDAVRQEIEYLKSLDIDVKKAEKLLSRAEERLTSGDFGPARRCLSRVKNLVGKERRDGAIRVPLNVKVAELDERRKKTRMILNEIRKVGVDVTLADEYFTLADRAIEEGRMNDARHHLEEVEDIALTLRESLTNATKDLLLKSKRTLERAISDGLEIGIGMETLKSGFRALERNQFDDALQYAEIVRNTVRRARKESLADKALEALRTMEQSIEGAKRLGVDVESVRSIYAEAKREFDLGQYEKVEAYSTNIDESLREARKVGVISSAKEEIEALSTLVREVEGLGPKAEEARALLQHSLEALDSEDFRTVKRLNREARRLAREAKEDQITRRFGEKSRGLAAMISEARTLGVELGEVEALLAEAEEKLSKQQTKKAKKLLRDVEISAGKKIREFVKEKYPRLLVILPKEGLQSNAWNKYVFEVVNEGELRSKNVEIRLDGDFETKGLEVIPEIDPKEKRKVEIGLRPQREGKVPVTLKVKYERPFDSTSYEIEEETKLAIQAYGSYVVEDVFLVHNDGRLICHQSRKYREEIDEDIFSGMLTIVQDFVKDSFRKRSHKGLKRLDFGSNKIVIERGAHIYLAAVVVGNEPLFLPLRMAEIIREIEEKYGGVLENWSGMLSELKDIDEMIRSLVFVTDDKEARLEDVEASTLLSTLDSMEEATRLGADVSEPKALLERALRSVERKGWQDALGWMERAENSAKNAKQKHMEKVQEEIDRAQELVNKAREMGIDFEEIESVLEASRDAILTGRFKSASDVLDELRSIAKQGEAKILLMEAERDLQTAKELVMESREQGMDLKDLELLLSKAESAKEAKDYETVKELVVSLGGKLEEHMKQYRKKKASRRIESFALIIGDAKEAGIDVGGAEELLQKAKEAVEKEDLQKIELYVGKAKSSTEKVKKMLLLAEAGKKLEKLLSAIKKAEEMGIEVSEPKELATQAKINLEEGDLEALEHLMRKADSMAEDKIQGYIKNRKPHLLLEFPTKGFQAGSWNKYVFRIENKGKLGARNVDLTIEGDFDVRGLERIPEIDVNEKKEIEIGIKPRKSGRIPMDVSATYQRYFDEKIYEIVDQENLDVEERGTYLVEDAFLIHNKGELIAHVSRKYREELDEESFGGMIGAVQDFLKDAFVWEEKVGLNVMDFGETKILIERGLDAHLAAVLLGREPRMLPLYMLEILMEIHEKYGNEIRNWKGDTEVREEIRKVLRKLVFATEVPGAELDGLQTSQIAKAFGIARGTEKPLTQAQAENLIKAAREKIEKQDVFSAWNYVRESLPEIAPVPGGIPSQERERMTTEATLSMLSAEMLKEEIGELQDEKKLKDYLRVINEISRLVLEVRRDAGIGLTRTLKTVAMKPTDEFYKEVATIFKRVISKEVHAEEFVVVPSREEWSGLNIEAVVHKEALAKKYQFLAKRIEVVLKSTPPWKIKKNLDKGEFSLWIEGQPIAITSDIVSFNISIPEDIIIREFQGGKLYVDISSVEELSEAEPLEAQAEDENEEVSELLRTDEETAKEIAARIREMKEDLRIKDEDYVDVKVSVSPELKKLISAWKEAIIEEGGCRSLQLVEKEDIESEEGYVIEWQVEDEVFTICIQNGEAVGSK